MNIVLWVLQLLTAILYAASGVMKLFMFDKISKDVPSFGALPRGAWIILGIVELVCTLSLIAPDALRWHPTLTVLGAVILALEGLVFVWLHIKYAEMTPIILSAVLALTMAFIAYGRLVLRAYFLAAGFYEIRFARLGCFPV